MIAQIPRLIFNLLYTMYMKYFASIFYENSMSGANSYIYFTHDVIDAIDYIVWSVLWIVSGVENMKQLQPDINKIINEEQSKIEQDEYVLFNEGDYIRLEANKWEDTYVFKIAPIENKEFILSE